MYELTIFHILNIIFPDNRSSMRHKRCNLSTKETWGKDENADHHYPITTQWRLLMHWRKKPFGNIVEKEENAGNQHFLLFPPCLSSYETQL